ncbi:WYL domain-containing protein [Microlunatus spumicola]|uniref:WYL domain-containing protein n=1 Tax=Microlunatus spumicola TaxID=81499 RepID=A0ABP6X0H8_9ACTN
MARPTARVLGLLEILQAGGTHTLAELAGRLGVDERTVRRYVVHLLDLDVPVESVRGRYGGYRLAPTFKLPPLMFTDEEATAVLVGLLASARTSAGAARLAAESAAAKVRRALPRRLASRLDALLGVVEVSGTTSVGLPAGADVLLAAAEAARAGTAVDVVHTSREDRVTERVVQPYGIVAHGGHWYLTGLDVARDQVRTFRLDRITTVRPRAERFEVPVDFSPQDAVLQALAGTPWRHEVSVRVHADEATVRRRLPAGLATLTPVADDEGWTRVELRAERLDWVPATLAALDADLVVERPDELRGRLQRLGRRLLDA